MHKLRSLLSSVILLSVFSTTHVAAEDMTALDNDIHAAIKHLLDTTPAAKRLAATAKGALVFPSVKKAGFIAGIQYGNGALVRKKQGGGYYIASYYNITSASFGYQAGVQTFGYVVALMSDQAVQEVETSHNFELGVGPSVVVVDAGVAKNLTTETIKNDIYVFSFDQKGLMAGAGIQGTKITRLNK
jgi:lipid-binding SYLF domain-containing protein